MKRRIIRPNVKSYTGRHAGGGSTVRFESALERDFITLIRSHPDFLEILEQPEKFTFEDSQGKQRSYTPDFLVKFTKHTVYYEIKYRDQLRQDWERYREIVHFMRGHVRQRESVSYRIVTDLTIRTPRFQNARLLAPYLSRALDPSLTAGLLECISAAGPITISDLLRRMNSSNRGQVLATLWSMLAQQMLQTDLKKPLSMNSVLEVPHA